MGRRRKDKTCFGESGKAFTEEGLPARHQGRAEIIKHTKAGKPSIFEEL